MNEEWQPPEPPDAGADPLISLDPRVDTEHRAGVLPCPNNPPPPVGWEYWKGPIPNGGASFAGVILRDSQTFPMGAFVQTHLDGMLVGARVEWHNLQGATGLHGCFRGVNLMRTVTSE